MFNLIVLLVLAALAFPVIAVVALVKVMELRDLLRRLDLRVVMLERRLAPADLSPPETAPQPAPPPPQAAAPAEPPPPPLASPPPQPPSNIRRPTTNISKMLRIKAAVGLSDMMICRRPNRTPDIKSTSGILKMPQINPVRQACLRMTSVS